MRIRVQQRHHERRRVEATSGDLRGSREQLKRYRRTGPVPEPRPGAVEARVARMLAEAEAITGEAALTGGPDEENPGSSKAARPCVRFLEAPPKHLVEKSLLR